MNEPLQNERIYGLDLFRSIAILLVLFFHGNFLLQGILPGFPYFRIPDGVELFFVLSGFLIGGILIRDLEKNKTATISYLFYFWKRRWLRTLPAYYVILIINIIVVNNHWNVCDPASINFNYFLFLQNFYSPAFGFFWESWSLSIEEWFYIFYPALTIALVAIGKNRVKASLLSSILLAIFLPLLFRHTHYPTPDMDSFWYDVTFRKVVLFRIDSIIYGVLAAWIAFYFKGIWKRIRVFCLFIGLAGILLLINLERDYNSYFYQVLYFPIISLSASLLLPYFSNLKSNRKDFITFTSRISYSLYLVHLGLVAMVIDNYNDELSNNMSMLMFFIYLLVSYIFAYSLYRAIEKPFMDMRK